MTLQYVGVDFRTQREEDVRVGLPNQEPGCQQGAQNDWSGTYLPQATFALSCCT